MESGLIWLLPVSVLIIMSVIWSIGRMDQFRRNNIVKKLHISWLLIILLLGLSFGTGCEFQQEQNAINETLEVHFIDVGQGDSIFIKNGTHMMLVDAGNNDDSVMITQYLQKQGVSRLEYVIGTHPHEDHIGGMDAVIRNFEINRIFLPRVTHDTETYKDVLRAMLSESIGVTIPEPGKTYKLGDASFTILAPVSTNYKELNNYSIVIKLNFGGTSYLLTGDAEELSEQEMLAMDFDVSADVLKLGHHGSSSSSSVEFLNAVKPDFAVISVGKDNDYGHPHMETMLKLRDRNIPVYRTDENGTIISVTDGKNITFNTEAGSYAPAEAGMAADNTRDYGNQDNSITVSEVNDELHSDTVYITENGRKYHRAGCRFVNENAIEISREEAIECGYEPCLLCKP